MIHIKNATAAAVDRFMNLQLYWTLILGRCFHTGRLKGRDVIGTTVQHYRIVERLGAGGMGEVYRADDLRLGRPVALKFLSPSLKSDPESRARLLNEARAASMLRSPNIAVTYDIGESEGADFIAMEYVDGESLSARLARGPLPSARSRPGRDPGRRCARRGALARHHPSRHQERQPDADGARSDQGARLRSRQDPAAGSARRHQATDDDGRHGDRDGVVHGARAGARQGRSIIARTCSRSASCCSSC